MLPGTPIHNDESLAYKILCRINPENVAPIVAMKSWEIASVSEVIDEVKKIDICYILYKHPIYKKKDRLAKVSSDDLIEFINRNINPERGEGVDIIIVSSDFNKAFVFNHDGDAFKA
jgi:hypothetical protein